MKLKQLSVFLENQPGHLSRVCEVLAQAKINIITMTLADTQEFGILRLIIREWQQAKTALEELDFIVNVSDVIAVEVDDQPGGLEKVLKIAESNALSVEYMYAFTCKKNQNAIIVIRFDNIDNACSILEKAGVKIFNADEFYVCKTNK